MEVKLGQMYKDKITGFKGVASSRIVFLWACSRVGLTPKELQDGKPAQDQFFDEHQVELLKEKGVEPKAFPVIVTLGKVYKDKITGFKGIATSRSEFLYTAPRIGLSPKDLFDGKPIMEQFFDENQLELTKEKGIDIDISDEEIPSNKRPGGPGIGFVNRSRRTDFRR